MNTLKTRFWCLVLSAVLLLNMLAPIAHAEGPYGVTGFEGLRFECLYRWGNNGYNDFIPNADERLFVEFVDNVVCHFGAYSYATYTVENGVVSVTKWIERNGFSGWTELCQLRWQGEHLYLASVNAIARPDDYDFLLYRVGSEEYNRLCKENGLILHSMNEEGSSCDYTYNNFTYGEVEITGYLGNDISLAVPATLDGCQVTSLGARAFAENDNLINVKLPAGIQQINSFAFIDCDGLTTVSMSEGLISIGHQVFAWCHSLSDVQLPNSLTTIGTLAFQGCDNLRYLTLSDNVTSIADDAFKGCTNLTLACSRNSYAWKYAVDHNIPVVEIESKTGVLSILNVDAGHENGLVADGNGGRGIDVNVTSNVAWQVTVTQGSDWITLSTTSGNGNGTFYTITTANSGEERRGTIQVSANGCETLVIPVVQSGVSTYPVPSVEGAMNVERDYTDLIESEGGVVASLDDTFGLAQQNAQETSYIQVTHNGQVVYPEDVIQLRNSNTITLTVKMSEEILELYDIQATEVCVWNDLDNTADYSWFMDEGTFTWATEDTVTVTLKNRFPNKVRLKKGKIMITFGLKNGETRLLTVCSFMNQYSDTVDERLTIDGITVDMTYGIDQAGETFAGKKDSSGNYMSAVWFSPNYAEIKDFKEKNLLLGIWDVGGKSSIDSKYVVEMGTGVYRVERAISHILYLSPEDVKKYAYFMDNEASIQCWYGLCYFLCSCVDIDLGKYLPYQDMMLLLFDENFSTEDGKIDFYTAVELIADFLSESIGKEHPAIKILLECKSFIRLDEFTRAISRGGLFEVSKKWRDIFDVEAFILQASKWALKYDIDSLVEYLEGKATSVFGAVVRSIETGITAGLVLGTSVAQMKKKNAMQQFVETYNAPIAIAFYYSPVRKAFEYVMFTVESKESNINALSNGAYDFSCIENEKIGLNKWKGLREFYSPTHNAGILRGGITFDREMVWRILLQFLT